MQNYHFKVLKNPKTQNYLDLKDWVLSENFLWAYHETSTPHIEEEPMGKGQHINVPYYTHTFLLRPETNRYSSLYHSSPEDLQRVIRVIDEIAKANDVKFTSYVRISANAVHPNKFGSYSLPHIDHTFPHGQIILYLTDAGGNTYIEDVCHEPSEDDAIAFQGKHYMQTPYEQRRVIIVATFI